MFSVFHKTFTDSESKSIQQDTGLVFNGFHAIECHIQNQGPGDVLLGDGSSVVLDPPVGYKLSAGESLDVRLYSGELYFLSSLESTSIVGLCSS